MAAARENVLARGSFLPNGSESETVPSAIIERIAWTIVKATARIDAMAFPTIERIVKTIEPTDEMGFLTTAPIVKTTARIVATAFPTIGIIVRTIGKTDARI
ncbi:MAG: hypothetical protein AAF961_08640 [Planctomycetota bacterium]